MGFNLEVYVEYKPGSGRNMKDKLEGYGARFRHRGSGGDVFDISSQDLSSLTEDGQTFRPGLGLEGITHFGYSCAACLVQPDEVKKENAN